MNHIINYETNKSLCGLSATGHSNERVLSGHCVDCLHEDKVQKLKEPVRIPKKS